MSDLLIPEVDYHRIASTLHAVLQDALGDISKACLWFNIIGAFILKRHYQIDARPVAGVAGYCILNEPRTALFFAHSDEGRLIARDGAFHCWVETTDWAVDFAAPLFPIEAKARGCEVCPSKMMQKPISSAKLSPNELKEVGDFYVEPDREFTQLCLKTFADKPSNLDLLKICEQWYKRPPIQMRETIHTGNEDGTISRIEFAPLEIVGRW